MACLDPHIGEAFDRLVASFNGTCDENLIHQYCQVNQLGVHCFPKSPTQCEYLELAKYLDDNLLNDSSCKAINFVKACYQKPAPSGPPDDSQPAGMGTLQIVGIVVGVLVAVICGVTIFTVLMIRGLRRSRRPLPRLPNSVPLAAAPCHFPQDDRASAVYAVIDDEQDNTEGDGYARLPDDTSFERPASLPVDYLHPNAPSSEAAKSPYDMLQPSDQRRQSQPYTSLKASMKSPRGADSMLKDHLQPDATCLPTRSMTADTLRPDDYLHPTALPAETHLPDDYLRPADPSVRLSKSPYDRLQCLGQRLHSAPYTRLQVCARSPPRADSLPGDYLHPTGLHATEDPEQPTLSPRPTGNGLRSPSTAADYLHPIGSPATSNSRPDDYLHPVAPQALVCRVSHAPANETAVDHPASTGSSRTPLGDVATETAASPNQRTETGTSLDHDHEFGEYIEPFQRPQDSRSPRCTPNT